MPQMTIPKKLLPFIQKPKRFKIAIGGRGSGKSMSFADMCIMDAQTKSIKTACFREFQNSIDDSVYSLLDSEIHRLNVQGFEIQNNRILYKGQEAFKFKGLARNPEAVKSMHGFNRFWVEEAQTISYRSLKALTPTLREANSEVWMSANPMSSADPFSQRFIKPYERELNKNGYYEDDLHLIVKINWSDNPFFPEVLRDEMEYDREHLSTAEYMHIWEGHFNDEVDGSIISVDWFNAAIDAHEKIGFKPKGAKIVAFDPSDTGDAKGYALRHGSVVLDVCDSTKGDVNDGCDWAIDKAMDANADYFYWDGDGIGAALNRQVEQGFRGTKTEINMFKGSNSVDDPKAEYQNGDKNEDTFRNKRAQCYWMLRDRFAATYRAVVKGEYVDPDEMISLSSNIECLDQLRAEVCRVPRKKNSNGYIQIMSKQDMLKQDIASPNMADSLMMTMVEIDRADTDYTLNCSSMWG